jgi:hypothetical protein
LPFPHGGPPPALTNENRMTGGHGDKFVCNRRNRRFFWADVLKFNLRRLRRLLNSFRNFIRRLRRFFFFNLNQL